ncbi:MAG: hypothetical protein WKG03_07740 [Telluria sp.]
MQLKNDLESRNLLDDAIYSFYKKYGNREVRNFLHTKDGENDWDWHYTYFLIDRKHVIRYGYGQDRNFWVGGIELGIGLHYFSASAFWSYENSERFTMEASIEGVQYNLSLLDEFLGYKFHNPTPFFR